MQIARDKDGKVVPVPGASAVLAAVVASGFESNSFSFVGFAPNRSNDRKQWLSELTDQPGTVVFFEAPHRVRDMLAAKK